MPQTTPTIKVNAVTRPRRRGGAARRRSTTSAYEHAQTLVRETTAGVRASLRRSGRDRGAGHDRRWRSCASRRGEVGRDLRAGRRRRAHRRHRRLCEISDPAHQDHRRRAGWMRRPCTTRCAPANASRSITSACSPTASRCSSVGEETFRLAPRTRRRGRARRHRRDLRRASRTSSRTRVPSSSPRARSRWRASRNTCARTTGRTNASSPSTAART